VTAKCSHEQIASAFPAKSSHLPARARAAKLALVLSGGLA